MHQKMDYHTEITETHSLNEDETMNVSEVH